MDKQTVRTWMGNRVTSNEPPPTPEEIRRQLGWDLIVDARKDSRYHRENEQSQCPRRTIR